jgi:amino-acid N-acetyltransferase
MEAPSNITVVIRPARPADRAAIEALLSTAQLPLAGVGDHLSHYLVAVTAGGIVGAVGVEHHAPYGLLRSAVVSDTQRGRGIGAVLVIRAIERARAGGLRALYLLTTTASDWFPRHGFVRVSRESLPKELEASEELRGACPDTAICMELRLAT